MPGSAPKEIRRSYRLNHRATKCIRTVTRRVLNVLVQKRAVLVGGHLARLTVPKDCEPGRQRGEDVAALFFCLLKPTMAEF